MSLVAFQELFASLIADPALCKKIIANPSLLETDYDLTEREIKRINSFLNKKEWGLIVCCIKSTGTHPFLI